MQDVVFAEIGHQNFSQCVVVTRTPSGDHLCHLFEGDGRQIVPVIVATSQVRIKELTSAASLQKLLQTRDSTDQPSPLASRNFASPTGISVAATSTVTSSLAPAQSKQKTPRSSRLIAESRPKPPPQPQIVPPESQPRPIGDIAAVISYHTPTFNLASQINASSATSTSPSASHLTQPKTVAVVVSHYNASQNETLPDDEEALQESLMEQQAEQAEAEVEDEAEKAEADEEAVADEIELQTELEADQQLEEENQAEEDLEDGDGSWGLESKLLSQLAQSPRSPSVNGQIHVTDGRGSKDNLNDSDNEDRDSFWASTPHVLNDSRQGLRPEK